MKIEISDITGFIKAQADEGMVLTTYHDGDPIDTYIGIKTIHVNKMEALINVREITFAEHEAYEEEKRRHEEEPEEETIEEQ